MNRRYASRPENKKCFGKKLLNQTAVCIILLLAVMFINGADKDRSNVFIKNLRAGLNTSVDYKQTAESLKKFYGKIIDKGAAKDNDADEKADGDPAPDTDLR